MHLPQTHDHEKQRYARESSVAVRAKHLISFLTWILVIIGFYLTYQDSPLYLATFGPLVLFVLLYLSVSNIIACLYKPFPYGEHQKKVADYWEQASAPSVDIFLPICGEPLEVLRNTWEGVYDLAKSYPGIVSVHVLEDKDCPEARQLARSLYFNYLARPDQGQMKKAGNLKYGYQNSNSDFVLILDADFRPHPDMLHELLPYMADPLVAIVQSPQFFQTEGLTGLQYGAGNIQRHFYNTVQRARGSIGGSICVGSCALYRRTALDTVGGTYQIEHSEDVWTGFSLLSKGWKIQYIPIPLSKGGNTTR